MLIPTTLFGLYRDVKSRCRKLVKRLEAGETWQETVGSDELVDTMDDPGMIVLAGPEPLLNIYPHFHCYVLLYLLIESRFENRLTHEIENAIFNASLSTAWGVLGLISPQNVGWFVHPVKIYTLQQWQSIRFRPFLSACLQHWDTLYDEEARYTLGSTVGADLWSIPSNLKYVLANMGVSTEVLLAPLPKGGLAEIVAMTHPSSNL